MSVRRSTRGAYTSLAELERRAKAADAAAGGPLWGQEAFVEDEEDDDDQSFDADNQSDDGEDAVDSDFDQPEDAPVPDSGAQADKVVRVKERQTSRRSRTGKYVDPALKRRLPPSSAQPQKKAKVTVDKDKAAAHRPSLRRSTKIASERAAEEREKRQVDDDARKRKKALREAKKPDMKVLTQKELLEEAAATEVQNKESLKELLRLAEEQKRIPAPKKVADEPRMSMRSRGGRQTISFTSKDTDPREALFPHLHSS